ncbi:peptidylprolyl isomerase SurA [Aliiglaciecola sp. 3_MG-2023]|uniref:peptidylprolyl isomerase SurA n=1 Tax=Aliiglaciecola sp. 3_MG-2023 TaxID=3062644 RepID=UPI0026E2BEAF|nr:peptidylprolyl isomerase SurA [Aliiglaciecola sp. 3_MG-2023]MDO6695030.1 peptidylprolyl isomerase SurA [Aliiglaciecola sp. 3_MG-2023]
MKLLVVVIALTTLLSFQSVAQQVSLDKVAVIVDQGVILESEIDALVGQVKRNAETNNQTLPSDRALRTQAIEKLVTDNLQTQMAEKMGIQISDPQLDQTIAGIAANNNLSMDQFRAAIAKDGIPFEVYREDIRKELITQEVRRANVRRRVYITPQEIENLVKLIDEQGAEQAEYNLGHILIGFPPQPTDEDIAKAKSTADKVLELLNSGSDFTRIAIASSSGSKALEGGDLGWMNINSMPTLFAEAVQDKGKDEIVGPIRSGAGFHILKVKDLRGIEVVKVQEVNARHILIKPSVILSDEKAKEKLEEFRKQIIDGEATFEDLAKEHSADPGSAIKGGELGWNDPNIYVPAFKDALSKLEKDEIGQPFRSSHGWHLVQLIDKRVDDATDKRKEDKAYQLIFNRKFTEETDAWLREMRDAAYIEVLETSSELGS